LARLIEPRGGEGPANESERRVVEQLRRELPNDYFLVPNLEVAEPRGGQLSEYDLVVVAPHAVYVVEVKSIAGEIRGDEREWLVDGRSRRSPLAVTERKARILKSRLVDRSPVLNKVRVEAVVVLARRPAFLELDDIVAARVVTVEGAAGLLINSRALSLREEPHRLTDEILGALDVVGTGRRQGPVVIGDYEVIELLEQTDDETIYRARHRVMSALPDVRLRVVVLSPYKLDESERAQRREQLFRESEALLRMGAHPNVLGARSVFEDETRIVLVSDLPSGRSLRAALRLGTPLTLDERLRLLADVCRALAHAHSHDVIHRRLEPERVVIGDDGIARLDGFGWAKLLMAGAHTVWQETAVEEMDTAFVAPELTNPARGRVGPATDLYGLGSLAYLLFCGQPPYEGPDAEGSDLPVLPDEIPSAVRELLPALIVRDPAGRIADAPAVLRVLDDALGTTAPSRPPVATTNGEFEPGAVIDGRYEVRELLGRGGFSRVYRVYDPVMDDEFALKIFRDEGDIEKLMREVQILRALPAHTHVVRAIWADRTDLGHWYLVSELIRGEPLSRFIEGGRHLAPTEAIEAVKQVLSALQAIHPQQERIDELTAKEEVSEQELAELQQLKTSGVVHRDIKPQNVILDPQRGAVVIDFNIATSAGKSQSTLSGTPPYMPPDIGFADWTPDVDLFATGVVLYELLSGAHPYPDEQPRIDAHPIDPRQFRRELSDTIAAVLIRACAPHADERFATATEFLTALGSIGAAVVEVGGDDGALPAWLREVLSHAAPNRNPIVLEFAALGSQARRTTVGTRGLTELASATYVETRLDEGLAEAVLSGKHRLVVITGNAGDGKTAFIQRVERVAKARGAHVTPEPGGSRIEYAGLSIRTLYDGSQDEGERTSDEVLHTFFAPFVAEGIDDGVVRMAAINEGRLRDFVLAFRDEFPRLVDLLEQVDDPAHAAGATDLVVVNLNLRSVTAGGDNSIFTRQIRAIVDEPSFWELCASCDHRTRCPIKFNVDTFRDPTSGPVVTERLRRLVDVVRLRRRRHLTMRDVRSLISFILFRDRYCDEIEELLATDDPMERVDLAYFQGIAGLGVPDQTAVDRSAALLTEVDMANVSNPMLDRALADELGPRLMRFERRASDWPGDLITQARRSAGHGYGANASEARRVHAAHRRRVYFERNDEEWEGMLPYRRLLDFEAALQPEEEEVRSRLKDDVLRALSVWNGISEPKKLDECLWVATAEFAPGVFPSYRRFPREAFELVAVTTLAPYIESQPDTLELVHEPSGVRLRLDLDMLEVLQRLREGYVPSPEEARGLLVNLSLFKNRLLATAAEELVLCSPHGDVRISHGATPGSVELSEGIA
jgi:serine/threonine protein kinase